jgi:Plavaka transposase
MSPSTILKPLAPGMITPVILRCPDGHYRRVIYDLAAFIADYLSRYILQMPFKDGVQGKDWVPWSESCIWLKFIAGVPTTALPNDIDGECGRITREFTNDLLDTLDSKTSMWDEYGIDSDVLVRITFYLRPTISTIEANIWLFTSSRFQPFTFDFPRADILEILTLDLLHQLIKGTFKDHLVTWVCDYLALEHGEAHAKSILDDIDRR